MVVICGTGRACERACPVAEVGRYCPEVVEFIDELRERGLTLADVGANPSRR